MGYHDERYEPPTPGDPGWADWVDDQLAATEFDSELGAQLAADARRVGDGELSTSTFYDRYHEAVLDEFGVDRRPIGEPDDPHPHVPAVGDDGREGQNRRTMLKLLAGTAAATVGLPGCLQARGPGTVIVGESDDALAATGATGAESSTAQMGMVIDLERCQGALECMNACKAENNTPKGVHWNYVFRYAEEGEEEASNYLPRPCQHCTRPTCTYVCPTEARHKRDDGIVLTDYDRCVGCRYCQVACPYGVNFFQWGKPSDYEGFEESREDRNGRTVAGDPPGGVMGKCTFCVHRQDSGDENLEGTTACSEACPWGTLSFGDLNDPESDPRKHLAEKSGSHTFQLLESVGNGPNIIYIGPEPSSDATSGEGSAKTFEEMGFVDCRREVLDDRAPRRNTGGESHE